LKKDINFLNENYKKLKKTKKKSYKQKTTGTTDNHKLDKYSFDSLKGKEGDV
jgi:hypothetical protein